MDWHNFFVGLYLVILSSLGLYGIHRLILLYLFLKSKEKQSYPQTQFDELPIVTIQLPMFNERYVAERIIEAASKIDYPKDKLEIQVLDDSTDDTQIIARRAVEEKRAEGINIKYMHRDNRKGFKAGALDEGMKVARGEFIMVFDADFLPPPDILKKTIHYFSDEKVALVQTRWDHINKEESILTKVQALMLDGHFTIEHIARSRTGRFFNFNGTAGIWRKQAIIEAGGWEHDTITEDLDLSFRVQMLKKWKFIYVPEISVPAELPSDINGFKAQQFRWAKGSMQVVKKLLFKVLKANLPFKVKLEAFFHLTNNFAYVLMVPLALLILPSILFRQEHSFKDVLLVDVPLFLSTTFAIGLFYLITYRYIHGSFKGSFMRLLLLMSVGIGISLNNARAVIEGLFDKDAEFVRTPKTGVTPQSRTRSSLEILYKPPKSVTAIVEIGFATYFLITIIVALIKLQFFAIPFLLLFFSGYSYVGIKSLLPELKLSRHYFTAEKAKTALAIARHR